MRLELAIEVEVGRGRHEFGVRGSQGAECHGLGDGRSRGPRGGREELGGDPVVERTGRAVAPHGQPCFAPAPLLHTGAAAPS